MQAFRKKNNAESSLHLPDWVDSGTDIVLRYLLVMKLKGRAQLRLSSEGFQELFIDSVKIGETLIRHENKSLKDCVNPDETIGIDILPNLIGFDNEIENYL